MLEVILFYTLFVGYITYINNRVHPTTKSNKIIGWSAFFILFVLAGFRDFGIHNDTIPYVTHFMESIPNGPFWLVDSSDRFESGYQMYENFLHIYISSNPLVFNIISSLLVLSAFFLFGKKYCENISYLIILYLLSGLYLTQIGVLRQSLSVVFFYTMFIALSNKRYLLSMLCLFIAYSMHHSAILLVLVYACFFIKPTTRNIILLFISSLVVFFLYSSIFPAFLEDSRYLAESESKGFFNLTGLISFISSCVYLFVIYKLKNKLDNNPKDNPMLMISVLYCVVALLSIRIWIFVRFSMFFLPIILIFISNLSHRSKSVKYFRFLTLYLATSFFLLLYLRPEWYSIYPYRFVNIYNFNASNY